MSTSAGISEDNYTGPTKWDKTLEGQLQRFWGREFRPLQKQACRAMLEKRDVVLHMPCGGGKSLCYMLPAVIQKGAQS